MAAEPTPRGPLRSHARQILLRNAHVIGVPHQSATDRSQGLSAGLPEPSTGSRLSPIPTAQNAQNAPTACAQVAKSPDPVQKISIPIRITLAVRASRR
jgi:hypothetical protein